MLHIVLQCLICFGSLQSIACSSSLTLKTEKGSTRPAAETQVDSRPETASEARAKAGETKSITDDDVTAMISAKTGELKASIKKLSQAILESSISYSETARVFESLKPLKEPKVIEIDATPDDARFQSRVVVTLPYPPPAEELFIAVLYPDEKPKPLLVIVPAKEFPTYAADPSRAEFDTSSGLFVVALIKEPHATLPDGLTVSRSIADLMRQVAEKPGVVHLHETASISKTSLGLKWNAVSGAASYELERADLVGGSCGVFAKVATVLAGTTEYMDGSLTVDMTYCYRARAFNSSGAGPYSVERRFVTSGKVATPTMSLAAGTYNNNQSVSLSTVTAEAIIHYTLDGSNPTTNSTVYSVPLTVTNAMTLKAMATRVGYLDSDVSSATYSLIVATPDVDVTYLTGARQVSLSSGTQNASIYYSLDGATPTTASLLYSGPFSVTGHTKLRAMAFKAGFVNSTTKAYDYRTHRALVDPFAGPSNGPTLDVTVLSNGNLVVSRPYTDIGGVSDVGAVHLYDGATGTLISSLFGSLPSDTVGSGGVVALPSGHFVVSSPGWDGAGSDLGAVTWCSGLTGCSGPVTAANSLVGSTSTDSVGSGGATVVANGNYVVKSASWQNGAVSNAGAVTWCAGASGCTGVVSSANSLVGSSLNDFSNVKVAALANGNYLVFANFWDNGGTANVGAVTLCSGSSGCVGAVSATNSLVGSTAGDQISLGGVKALVDGDYVVSSPDWDAGINLNVGAVTFCSGTAGCTGPVSSANSLVGSTTNDRVGAATPFSNGDYVVTSPLWDNGGTVDAGAVTTCAGTAGCTGAISAANSLVGSTAGDQVGSDGVTILSNGNYVVRSPNWDNVNVNVGAATLCSGVLGCTGAVSPANSLVGSTANDQVSKDGVLALTNGNYVVNSAFWDNGGNDDVGASTWCPGTVGCTGAVTLANSLVGGSINDFVGTSGTALANGNYVVRTIQWHNGAAAGAGAVTWCSGTAGCVGIVSVTNSLVGTATLDSVGYAVTALTNGNYVVMSSYWDSQKGAVTWCSGTTGCVGNVSSANSFVGTTSGDAVGEGGITALSNGNYVAYSRLADIGDVNAGAVTWCSGTSGCVGAISSTNSLVGLGNNDQFGLVAPLSGSRYYMRCSSCDSATHVNEGLVVISMSGSEPISGTVLDNLE